jgi:hypothetical protein
VRYRRDTALGCRDTGQRDNRIMNSNKSNGCTPSFRRRTWVASIAGTAALCASLAPTTADAMANHLPGPDPAVLRVDLPAEPGPPNYPNYDPRYEVEPASAGIAAQWLQVGASTVAVIGIAGGVLWLYRRRSADT